MNKTNLAGSAPQGTIADQAQKVRLERQVAKIKKESEPIIEKMKDMIIDADINVGEFNGLMEAVNRGVANWYNSKINEKKITDVVNLESK
jgi:hypothetical protein